jgi:hypothetical protein
VTNAGSSRDSGWVDAARFAGVEGPTSSGVVVDSRGLLLLGCKLHSMEK